MFGVACSLIAVYEGYNAIPTAEGVGRATTRTVVTSAVLTLILDYMLTAMHAVTSRWGRSMRSTRTVEISTGLFVLLGFAALFFLVTQITNRELSVNGNSYEVTAQFENIGSLKPGAAVSMAGVTVGRVESIALRPAGLQGGGAHAHQLAVRPDSDGQRREHHDVRACSAGSTSASPPAAPRNS